MASDFAIRHAVHIINRGGIIAYPTDTIYGLGCNPYNEDAVKRLSNIKHRPPGKQFILLAGDIEQIKPLTLLTKEQQKRITESTEAISWVVDASQNVPAWLSNDSGTITIRLCKQDDVLRLCHALGHAIISTSANRAGKTPAKNALELHQHFHTTVDIILANNQKLSAKASKIIRLCDNQVIRN
jgi:L-threonylcarbamoyladenylate synthase